MDTIANDNVTPLLTPSRCPHEWQPVEGWQARYQCTLCHALGRKLRVLTLHKFGGPIGRPGVTAYRCRFKSNGVQCRTRAVARVDGTLRCKAHCCGQHTRAGRDSLGHR
ncbi:MAG: hypothetical protein ABSE49_08005 [Polyangiaceae bacterium]|jgi:hypothetical protein